MACAGVDQLWIFIDDAFPDSQPRVVAPSLTEDGSWPHVEGQGLLCLRKTRRGADPGGRIIQHIAWAVDVLNFDEGTRLTEFEREFATYWLRSNDGKTMPDIYSLVSPVGPSRAVRYYCDSRSNEIFLGEDQDSLASWLQNTGRNPTHKEIERTWMVWLPKPLVPTSFPKVGGDVLAQVPGEFLRDVARPGRRLPILMGATTETGPVWAVAEVSSMPENELLKGFRPGHVPPKRVIETMSARPIRRMPVKRADGAYVHGRGHDKDYSSLAGKRVAIVGCGALGGSVARMLAQAGVGQFLFADPDVLAAHNTARHVLGNRFVGKHKVDGMAAMLRQDFPHLLPSITYRNHMERMPAERWEKLADCNLIISSGIDFRGDAALNRWRMETTNAPPHVCAWVEPFALAGHGVALFGADNLMAAFNADGHPVFELTGWPDNAPLMIAEAGCGTSFQPHGAVDLQRIATMAARLALDVLLGKVATSCRRTWQGDRDEVLLQGGTPSESFQHSNVECAYSWSGEAPSHTSGTHA